VDVRPGLCPQFGFDITCVEPFHSTTKLLVFCVTYNDVQYKLWSVHPVVKYAIKNKRIYRRIQLYSMVFYILFYMFRPFGHYQVYKITKIL
jgi:hypothetical protein